MSATTTATTAAPASGTTAAQQPKSDDVTLLIQGKQYGGWKEVRVTRGMERACADFTLTVSERYPAMPQPWRISPGDACEVHIGNDVVITGWVDAFRPSFSATEHTVQVTGRSKTCDFVDSSINVDGGQFNGQTLLEIAKSLAQPYKLDIITQVGSGGSVADTSGGDDPTDECSDAQVQQSETCFQMVERLARLQEFLLTDDEQGRLVLCHPGDNKASTALVQGRNVLQANADLDQSKRFQLYVVKGQRPGNKTRDASWAKRSGNDPWGDVGKPLPPQPSTPGQHAADPVAAATREAERAAWFAEHWMPRLPGRAVVPHDDSGDPPDGEEEDTSGDDGAGTGGGHDTATNRGAKVLTQVLGSATDTGINRYRVHVIMAEAAADDMDAAQRADWEMRRRIAKGLKATLTVIGWRQRDGRLWKINEMVQIKADWLGLDQELVISQVEFELGTAGKVTRLETTLPDAFLPERIKRKRQNKGHGRKGKHKGTGGGAAWGDVGH